MGISDVADQYFTYENRLASFQTGQQVSKRRASNASTKGAKAMKWPHKFLSGEDLAKAGFFYYPLQPNPDNVACFLCHKALDGWEEDDDPLVEHLKHSPDCGWAIVATIEKQDGNLSQEYPSSTRMIEARKATFGDKWPHEGKKGWKCKVKQMVDAGWKYTPTPEYDDMATCTYCALALDGWENSDKPLDEHFNRSPECPFFALINDHKQSPAAKRTKAKRDRTSKASRLSIQSTFTVASEAPSDLPAEDEDSILTTATNATSKRMTKGKKAAAGKGKKTKAKKAEPVEVVAAPEPEDDNFDVKVDIAPKPTRGKKRKSDEEHKSAAQPVDVEPHPAKRRATRTRGSTAVDDSILGLVAEAVKEPSKPAVRKGRPSRKVSTASVVSVRTAVPDDNEIDKALEADLERQLTEDEGEPTSMAPPKRPTRASKITKADHAMFNTEPVEIDEAAIDAEIEAMEVDSKPLPKAKGAKGKLPRKVSAKQRAAEKKAADAEAEAEAERIAEEDASQQIAAELEHSISMQHSSPVIEQKKQRASNRQPPQKLPGRHTRGSVMSVNGNISIIGDSMDQNNDSGNETDASMASQATIVRGGSTRRGSTVKRGKGGKKAPTRNIEEIVHKTREPTHVPEPEEPALTAKGKGLLQVEDVSMDDDVFYTPAPEAAPEPEPAVEAPAPKTAKAKAANPRGRPKKVSDPAPSPKLASPEVDQVTAEGEPVQRKPIATKEATPPPRSPSPPAKGLTPSQSPQSSDAENHPPSSKPSAATQKAVTPQSTKRIPLAETTPMLSPSKRNIIAGLQSNQPWISIDLDTIFEKSPGDENVRSAADIFGVAKEKVKNGDLTSPEKKMTVEEWIHHNAQMAEERLRNECERMVGTFEREGTRAMQALEGVDCLE